MKFYTSIHEHYDKIFPLNLKQLAWIKSSLGDKFQILDIGCATGSLANALAQKGHLLWAFDLDKSMVEKAIEKYGNKNPEFKVANMLNIQQIYSQLKFNSVLCMGNTLVHLSNESLLNDFISSVNKLLTNKGILLMQLLNYEYILEKKPEYLPLIDNSYLRFKRQYKYLENERISFQTELLIKANDQVMTNEIILYPIKRMDLQRILRQNGYKNITFQSSYDQQIYMPEALPLIVRAEK